MKKLLLLSSNSFLEKDFTPILKSPLNKYKLAHIITASKGKGVNSLDYLQRTRDRLTAQKCSYEDFDIDRKNKNQIRNFLKEFDGVYVNGGSTFYLLKAVRESGFGEVIKELLPTGFLYMGSSAGAYITCPTIEMATWKHKNKYDHYNMTDFSALNLVPFLVTAHYSDQYKEILQEKIPQSEYPVRILSDEQALLIENEKETLFGGKAIDLFPNDVKCSNEDCKKVINKIYYIKKNHNYSETQDYSREIPSNICKRCFEERANKEEWIESSRS